MSKIHINNPRDIQDPALRAKIEAALAAQEGGAGPPEESPASPPARPGRRTPPQPPEEPSGPPGGGPWRPSWAQLLGALAAAAVLAAGAGAYIGVRHLAARLAPPPFSPERVVTAPPPERAQTPAEQPVPPPVAAPEPAPPPFSPPPVEPSPPPPAPPLREVAREGPVTQPSSPAEAYGPRSAEEAPAVPVDPKARVEYSPDWEWGNFFNAPPEWPRHGSVKPCAATAPDGSCIPHLSAIYPTHLLPYACTSLSGNRLGGAGYTRSAEDCRVILEAHGSVMFTGDPFAKRICPNPITGTVTLLGNRLQLPVAIQAPGGDLRQISAIIDTGAYQTAFPDEWLRAQGFQPWSASSFSVHGVGTAPLRAWTYRIPSIRVNSAGGWVPLGQGLIYVMGIEGFSIPLIGPDALRESRLQMDGRRWILTPPCY